MSKPATLGPIPRSSLLAEDVNLVVQSSGGALRGHGEGAFDVGA